MSDPDDDDTVPTGRAGVDPLIAYPRESSASAVVIQRPGDGTPWWFIPAMFAIALGFMALWVVISESRSDDAASTGAGGAAASANGLDGSASPGDSGVADGATTTTIDELLAELPGVGIARVGPDEYDIVSVCEGHLPYDPVDPDTQVSSYFYFDRDGQRGVVERIVNPEGDTATRWVAGTSTSSPDVTVIGEEGAFLAGFDGGDVVVNPPVDGDAGCADRVVTNAPGQFAEPHVQIVLDICVEDRPMPDGSTISGLTAEGSRFEVLQAGGELAEVAYERGPDDLLRTSAPAIILRTDEVVSVSGIVSNGVDDLDLSIDVDRERVDAARTCTDADRW